MVLGIITPVEKVCMINGGYFMDKSKNESEDTKKSIEKRIFTRLHMQRQMESMNSHRTNKIRKYIRDGGTSFNFKKEVDKLYESEKKASEFINETIRLFNQYKSKMN